MAILNFFDVLALRPAFFDDAIIDARIDKEQLKLAILGRCGTLLPLYTNTEMFKIFSDSFFYQRQNTIKKLIDTTELEYNPIDNYSRTETTSRTNTLTAGIDTIITESLTAGIGSSVKETPNTSKSTQTTSNNNGDVEHFVSPYDSSTLVISAKDTTNEETSGQTTETLTGETTTATTRSGTDTTNTNTKRSGADVTQEKVEYTSNGNIGITTSQRLIKEEREVVLFNIYNWIAREYEQEFFICMS